MSHVWRFVMGTGGFHSWSVGNAESVPCHDILVYRHGPLARYVKLRVAHAPGMSGSFSLPPLVSDPDMCETHVPWSMPGSLTIGPLWSPWRGKRSRHSRRMRNPQFYVSGKMPIIFRGDVKLGVLIFWWHQPPYAAILFDQTAAFEHEIDVALTRKGVCLLQKCKCAH